MNTNSFTYRITSLLGKFFIKLLEFFVEKSVKNDIYLPVADFSWTAEIEKDFHKIKDEYIQFFRNQNKALDICKISEEQFNVVDINQWDFIPLYFYGSEIKEYSQHFPETIRYLQKIPNMTTAFFSIIKAGTFVKEHRGAYKGYLRYQIGVQIPVPEEQCGLKINEVVYHWKEGKSVIFDDTFMHSAWNHSAEDRTVLYVDFIRPMNRPLVHISKILTKFINQSQFVQNAIFNLNTELKKNSDSSK